MIHEVDPKGSAARVGRPGAPSDRSYGWDCAALVRQLRGSGDAPPVNIDELADLLSADDDVTAVVAGRERESAMAIAAAGRSRSRPGTLTERFQPQFASAEDFVRHYGRRRAQPEQ